MIENWDDSLPEVGRTLENLSATIMIGSGYWELQGAKMTCYASYIVGVRGKRAPKRMQFCIIANFTQPELFEMLDQNEFTTCDLSIQIGTGNELLRGQAELLQDADHDLRVWIPPPARGGLRFLGLALGGH